MPHTLDITTLPTLDLSLFEGTAQQRYEFLENLRHAARDVGFFYLTGHGIDSHLLKQVQDHARQFFALSEHEKNAVGMINSPHFRGYNRAASEITRGQPDWREQFDLGAEREALPLDADSPLWARLQGPNQWPAALPELKPLLLEWQQAMTRMALRLLRAFAQALSLRADAFDQLYGDKPNEHIKLMRYPGQAANASQQGVGAQLDAVVPLYPLPTALLREARGPASDPLNPLFRDVGWNYLKGRLRSHPDVARRFYADALMPAAPARKTANA